ncbi:MAG: hypothetical protein HLUCCA08_14180 [Rhodobacteraceae bacterium HLUCCA08]|nr:MAG: hypothetical protein HLUCCA08_14180 [Rhodobacteraceae bacterium HLUCCA08]
MRRVSVFTLTLVAGIAQAQEPDHGTIVTISQDGLDYAVQFWTGSDKVVIVGLPETDLRAYPPSTAEAVAARALAQVGMDCTLGPAGPDQYGLPAGTTYDVPYRC